MADLSALSRPSQLWKQLSSERKLLAADAFWRDEHANNEQMEVVLAIAQRMKFRPKSVIALPIEKKARYTVSLAGVTELVAARLLVAYHLHHQRPMMGAFLDLLGIKHENGLIEDEAMAAPSPEALAQATASLTESYPADDVRTYLTTLIWQDPETWGELAATPLLSPQDASSAQA